MAHKKVYLSVTATAVIASAFFAVQSTEAASHVVEPGDTLWRIAQNKQLSVAELKRLNGLSGDIIYPRQVLRTVAEPVAGPAPEVEEDVVEDVVETPTVSESQRTTYTVVRGDNLSRIALNHGITLRQLMTWNNLQTTLIFPGNVLTVVASEASAPPEVVAPPTTPEPVATDYTVKSGDTLSRIARAHQVSVTQLKQWNDLKTDFILIGQKLELTGAAPAPTTPVEPVAPDVNVSYDIPTLIATAKSVMGVPYVWGGQTVNGFDCSGYIHYTYNAAGRSGARMDTRGYYDRSYAVNAPQVGDLVFFSNTYRAGISHIGIYLGNNEFIHAGSSTGVTISNLNDRYWKQHFDSFKRFY